MRLRFLLLVFCYLPLTAQAQPRASEYVDVVYVKGGRELEGTIVAYKHGELVSIVLANGDLQEIDWDDIRRVNFKLDKDRLRKITRSSQTGEPTAENTGELSRADAFIPRRKTLHQLTGAINLGQTNSSRFGRGSTTIGGSFAYHLVREVSFLKVGAGVDLSLMSHSRSENVVSATVFGELPSGFRGRHVRPVLRLEAGPSLPFGSADSDNEIIRRQLSVMIHPSIGVEILPRKNQWGSLVFDLGYRFLDSRFTVITPNLDELERTVNYRRLVFRGGLRF